MRRQRGSALLFVSVMLVATTAVWIAVATLTNSALIGQRRRESQYIARAAIEGGIDQLRIDYLSGAVTLPATVNLTFAGASCQIQAQDNSSGGSMSVNGSTYTFPSIPKTIALVATVVSQNRTYAESRIVTTPLTPQTMYYTIWSDSDISTSKTVTTGFNGANGDIGCNGNVTLSSTGCQINGDIDSNDAISVSGSVNGALWQNCPAITMPNVKGFTLSNAYYWAQTFGLGSGSVNGLTFTPYFGNYPLYYHIGDLTVKGTITGCGTVFVTGNLSLNGNVTYGNSGSRVAFVVQGNVSVLGGCRNFAGYYFTAGSFTIQGAQSAALTSGAIACESLSLGGPFTATYDSTIYDTPTEGNRLKIPGMWP